jgi:hypothetical protein
MSSAIDQLDAEIARLQAEVARVEHMPRTIAERFAEAEAELRSAEALYQSHGLKVSAAHSAEHAHLQRQSLIGAMMVVNSAALLKAERDRIAAAGEGLSADDGPWFSRPSIFGDLESATQGSAQHYRPSVKA